jgi:hypothetical protein
MQDWRPGAIGFFDPVYVPRCLTSRTAQVPEGLASKGSFVTAFAQNSRGHRPSVSQACTGAADFLIRRQLPSFRFLTLVGFPPRAAMDYPWTTSKASLAVLSLSAFPVGTNHTGTWLLKRTSQEVAPDTSCSSMPLG